MPDAGRRPGVSSIAGAAGTVYGLLAQDTSREDANAHESTNLREYWAPTSRTAASASSQPPRGSTSSPGRSTTGTAPAPSDSGRCAPHRTGAWPGGGRGGGVSSPSRAWRSPRWTSPPARWSGSAHGGRSSPCSSPRPRTSDSSAAPSGAGRGLLHWGRGLVYRAGVTAAALHQVPGPGVGAQPPRGRPVGPTPRRTGGSGRALPLFGEDPVNDGVPPLPGALDVAPDDPLFDHPSGGHGAGGSVVER